MKKEHFDTHSQLTDHKMAHHQNPYCRICKKVLGDYKKLAKHEKEVHQDPSKRICEF